MHNCHYEENELKNHVTAPLTKPNFLLYMQFWLDFWKRLRFEKKTSPVKQGFGRFKLANIITKSYKIALLSLSSFFFITVFDSQLVSSP